MNASETIQRSWPENNGPYDLLVIGGGIVGAGVVRDASLRGLKTILVERHDFAFGTSSRSSRLLHGGLRYLAQGRVGLVREASVEKLILQQIAPHLADPLPFLFPTYQDNPNWKLWQLKVGVKIYDLLSGGTNFAPSSWLSPDAMSTKVPGLKREGLQGAVRYYDGFTNDARLTIDTLRSAARAGATLLNYCEFKSATANQSWDANVLDHLTGETHVLRAKQVVNATGPWADGLAYSAVKLRLTKGVHLVLDRPRLPVSEVVVMTQGKRILFAIPWGTRTIIGTTDTDYEGDPGQVRAEEGDIRYILGVANDFFPEAHLVMGDVISSWAGLRPLLADPSGKPSDISRAHEIRNPAPGWWDVAGGKLTTYRLMAEQTVDRLLQQPATDQGRCKPCVTAVETLLPPEETKGISGILPPELGREAVAHYCAHEWAIHLDDVMLRRTGWHYYLPQANQAAELVADWMADSLSWTPARRSEELARYYQVTSIGKTSPIAAQ